MLKFLKKWYVQLISMIILQVMLSSIIGVWRTLFILSGFGLLKEAIDILEYGLKDYWQDALFDIVVRATGQFIGVFIFFSCHF